MCANTHQLFERLWHTETFTHSVTVRLGRRLASGVSVSSSLLQLTLFRTPGAVWAFMRSSMQLQPLVRSPGQASDSLDSVAVKHTRTTSRRPHNGMLKLVADIVPIILASVSPESAHFTKTKLLDGWQETGQIACKLSKQWECACVSKYGNC